ncbi:DUF2269 domain-containing protein [Bacillus timonensis]|nr:DUF2269 domain-containing protein [Bacillus timonensis]
MLYTFLLFVHLLCVVVWLGGALVETFYFMPRFKKEIDGHSEVRFIRMWASSGSYYGPAIILLLLTGIFLSIMGGWGFFTSLWLSIKQLIMLAVLIILFLVAPKMKKLQREALLYQIRKQPMDDELRERFNKTTRFFDIIHIGVLINVVLAVWKF